MLKWPTPRRAPLGPWMPLEIFVHVGKKRLDRWCGCSLLVPGKLDRARRERLCEREGDDGLPRSIEDRLRKDRNAHAFGDQRTYRAEVAAFKDDLWEKTGLLCKM